jgi:hypothetical protein
MSLFKTEAEVYQILGTFFRKAAMDDEIGPDIQKSGLIIQFEYSDPHSVLTIDASSANAGNFYEVYEGQVDKKPDVQMTMKADIANKFWLGKVNLLTALSRRQMVAKGPIPKILKLLPAIQPAYKKYQLYLEEIGRMDLLEQN